MEEMMKWLAAGCIDDRIYHLALVLLLCVPMGWVCLVAAETTPEQSLPFQGEPISMNFQDIEIRSVLQLLADFTALNLVASDSIEGNITLNLKDVPWDQALSIIMKTKGLDKRQFGNVLMVAPAAELADRERLEMANQAMLSDLAPLRTEYIEVRYANAQNIFNLFQSSGENMGVLSGRGNVIVDERTNSIIMTETAEKIDEFRQVLEQLDVPIKQVLIEAKIVTASTNVSKSMGVRWGALGFEPYENGSSQIQTGASLEALNAIRGQVNDGTSPAFPGQDHLVVDLGIGAREATGFAVGIVNSDYLLELELSAMETQGAAEVIARPKVITADKQLASISSGVQIPYQEASASGATAISFAQAVLGLTVRPHITPDDRIIMELTVSQDTVGTVFNGVPSINTNNIETQALVKNGETIVLGGVYTTQTTRSVTKTPLVGDLPYLGRLFRRNTKSDDKQELLIFITPRLLPD